jgi:hypothetical protein
MMLPDIFYLSFILFSIVISVRDAFVGVVSRPCLWGAIFGALLIQWVINAGPPATALAGGLVGLAVFSLAFFVSGRRLGLADLWYAALMGIVFGPLWWHIAIGFACVYALLFFLLTRRRSLPFIPFMSVGGFTVLPFFLKMP